MASNQGTDDVVAMMDSISKKLREAVLRTLPCAFEQYVTISIPGQVIDTSVGGRYVFLELLVVGIFIYKL